MKLFDKVGIDENMFLGKVDNGFDNMNIVHNDTADELAVNDDSFEDIMNNDIVDEQAKQLVTNTSFLLTFSIRRFMQKTSHNHETVIFFMVGFSSY